VNDSSQTQSSPVRVLFLAWGFSIHAWRRIRIFEQDPHFSVTVVSSHDYGFDGATNVLLHDARKNTQGKTSLNKAALAMCELKKLAKDALILRKAVRTFRPQVIFLQTLLYPCYLAFLMPKSIPIIITFWNGDVLFWSTRTGTERVFKKRFVLHGMKRAKALTVNSRAAMNACLAYGVPESRIHLIRYPGVDREKFRPAEKPVARETLRIAERKVILCPRGLGGYLNSDVIVESAAGVVKRFPDALFLFVSGAGSGEFLNQHREKIRQLGLEQHFRWEGQVPWDLMPVYYNASDLMVSISSNDSLPNCMMEALACELPVIMGDIPQIREWISDGNNGLLVPPRDPDKLSKKIVEVLELPADRINPLTENGRDLVAREFDSSIHSETIKRLVRGVAEH
jgi:glycosyltransferase involved in cell wall biosynthesis